MGQALYRKYRSKRLDEIVGQEHITKTLANALKNGHVSHAYLLTGPRGVGKTSIARILAHEINQLDYSDDATHLDIIEIDAASNRRIDEIRDLREKVHTAPTSAKFKVYIIDEVHMLTKEAFNALLKTLEEPPAHAVFILATTEAHKLPETIVSRTQRFTFKPIEPSQVVAHLRTIATQEKITIDDEALALIAAHGGGSFRDSISLLDQVRGFGASIDASAVQSILGIPPHELIHDLAEAVYQQPASEVVQLLETLYTQGYQAPEIAKRLGAVYRQHLLDGVHKGQMNHIASLLRALVDVPASHNPQTALEISLLTFVGNRATDHTQTAETVIAPQSAVEPKAASVAQPTATIATAPPKPQRRPPSPPEPESVVEQPADESSAAPAESVTAHNPVPADELWNAALDAIKSKHNTLYGIARMADATIDGNRLILQFKFAFHQKRLNDVKNKQIIGAIVSGLSGTDMTVECVTGATKPMPAAKSADTPLNIDAISNIFGEVEMLE